jgi:hypothetical protein
MRARHAAPYLGCIVMLGALLTAPSAFATVRHDARPALAAGTVGHLAYVTKTNQVDIATVSGDGNTSSITKIGPVTKPSGPDESVQIVAFVASGDGDWVAWQEDLVKDAGKAPTYLKTVLVLRNLTDHSVYQLVSNQYPIGFAGDQLVTTGTHAERLVLKPSPHLVEIPDSQYAWAAYPNGVVDAVSLDAPAGPKHTERLRLTDFDGDHIVLHNYVLGPRNYRIPDAGWVSDDGRHLVIERGDHTDFGGVGPSSVADEYALQGRYAGRPLGHFGTDGDRWRVQSVSFAGKADQVWAVWDRAVRAGATSVVAVHSHGEWQPVLARAIAVAGNAAGFVVVQPGKYVAVGSSGIEFDLVPTGDAIMVIGGATKVLGIGGSALAWVS